MEFVETFAKPRRCKYLILELFELLLVDLGDLSPPCRVAVDDSSQELKQFLFLDIGFGFQPRPEDHSLIDHKTILLLWR